MTFLIKTFVVTGLVLLLLLTIIGVYAYSQIRALSLPISQVFAIISFMLPLVSALSTQATYRLLRNYPLYARPILYLAIFAAQLIYETIVATLSVVYMIPSCRLDEQWKKLYHNKDETAIRRIQDRFNCCGFNSAVDRAWPFPHGRPEEGFGNDQCTRMFGRDRSCAGPWGQSEQINAGLFFMVGMTILVFKFIVLFFQLSNTSRSRRFFGALTGSDLDVHPSRRSNVRLAIGEGDQAAAAEPYHDEVEDGVENIVTAGNGDGNVGRSRVEPSGLGTSNGGELWRDEV